MLFEESVTVKPPLGAAWASVTVQLDVAPDTTLPGEHCNPVTLIGVTVTAAVAEPPFREAVSVTLWLAVTLPAVAVKVPEVDPAATTTEAGTVSAALLDDNVTVEPPVGAACGSVIVQFEVAPETTLDGEHCSVVTVTGVTAIEAVAELPFSEAVTVAT